MKTLREYMNDPLIINEPMPVREVRAIRAMICDETKGMTDNEITDLIIKRTAPIVAKYNLKVIKIKSE